MSGTAPNRIFNIEWRAVYMDQPDQKANFELRLYEGQNKFDVIYGTLERRQQQRHGGSAVQRYLLCSVLLQRLRWFAYWRLDRTCPGRRN